jgi:hypothetical protein
MVMSHLSHSRDIHVLTLRREGFGETTSPHGSFFLHQARA